MTLSSAPTPAPRTTNRAELLAQIASVEVFDLIVVGGGATGLGVALDAASRGLRVALLEAHDFAKGTSSRATKLVHGGVRYLAQGNIALVKEALHERATLLRNANHLATPLSFVMPSYHFWESTFYGTGLKMYDALAGSSGLGATELLSSRKVTDMLPNVNQKGLRGGVQYWDGQFDDARLALALARTAALHGALLVNYCTVEGLFHDAHGRVAGVVAKDAETGSALRLQAKCVVNATGVWVDRLRQSDAAATTKTVDALVTPSQGVHLVVDKEFWPSQHALLVPKTRDGRVLFAVPWLGKVVLGTTDTPRQDVPCEPQPFAPEVGFILQEAGRYLARAPQRADVRSMWAGLRPLARPGSAKEGTTKTISREHTISIAGSGLVSVTGGKWTTYRAMAEDVIRQCQLANLLPVQTPACKTSELPLVGAASLTKEAFNAKLVDSAGEMTQPRAWSSYGQEAQYVKALPGADVVLDAGTGLTESMVHYAVRYEYARTVEDVLARRSRLLFLDAAAALNLGARVSAILEQEGIANPGLDDFSALARQYLLE